MAKRTNKNICLNCFGDLNPERLCPVCGKKADDEPSPLHHFPLRAILKDKTGQERYLMGKALGEGGFGITYGAWDLLTGEKVAIKEYFPSGYVTRAVKNNSVIINGKHLQAASNRGMRRFTDEAKILMSLKKLPGVVTVKEYFTDNGTAYIVMEFLDGVSLKTYLKKRGGKIPPEEALKILLPIMAALTQIHETGLVHRDISPDNIIITKTGEAKLIDFGAAKQNNTDGKSISIVLKQGFAPEEQYRTHGELGAWTDIYAMAVTIYFSVTGQLPPESIQRTYRDTLIRPIDICFDLTPAQDSAIVKALSVYAKNRYQTMDKFIDALIGRGAYANLLKGAAEPAAANAAVKPSKTAQPAAAANTAATGKTAGLESVPTPGAGRKTVKAVGAEMLTIDRDILEIKKTASKAKATGKPSASAKSAGKAAAPAPAKTDEKPPKKQKPADVKTKELPPVGETAKPDKKAEKAARKAAKIEKKAAKSK